MVGDDPRLASLVESSDFHYAVTDQLKLSYSTTLTTELNVDNSIKPPKTTVTFHLEYLRPDFAKLKEAIGELCRYFAEKGAVLNPVLPPEPEEPQTKPFDQEKSNFYGQNSVTQPYHTPAQIAAAAQGTLPMYQMGNQLNHNFHQNGGHHHHNVGGVNGYHGYPGQPYGRGGYPPMPSGSFGLNRAMNAGRGGHHNVHPPPPGYQNNFPSFQAPGRGNPTNHGPFNSGYGQVGGGMNGHLGANGYHRRYVHTPPTPSGEPHLSPGGTNLPFQPHPRPGGVVGGMVIQSPLDTLSSLELPDIPNPPNNSGNFRSAQDGHTPVSNVAPFSPQTQSYFPPQPTHSHHNGFGPGQGYPGPPGSGFPG